MSGELHAHGFASFLVAVPLGVGLICFVALMLVEYHKRDSLSPIKKMWTTVPVCGTLTAMIGGGVFVTYVTLLIQRLITIDHWTPLAADLVFWPQVTGALLTAALLGFLFSTRFLSVLTLSGMLLLIPGGAPLVQYGSDNSRLYLLAAVGVLGAGATVAPGLFLSGFSPPIQLLGHIFALIELVRSMADFILSPVISRIATVASAPGGLDAAGVTQALFLTVLIASAETVIIAAIYLLGGAGLPKPDLVGGVTRNRPAIHSTRLLRTIRHR